MILRNAKEEYLGGGKEFPKVELSTYMRENYSTKRCPRSMSISMLFNESSYGQIKLIVIVTENDLLFNSQSNL